MFFTCHYLTNDLLEYHKHTLKDKSANRNFSPSPPLMSAYSNLIIKATRASGDDVAIIENFMREEILHSTFDCQTARQCATAARTTQPILREDYGLCHLVPADPRLAFREPILEHGSLNQATADRARALCLRTELEAAQQSLHTTRQALDRFFKQAFSPA